jgi:predicted transcriptional regulator
MRTTIRLDTDLHSAIADLARRRRTSFTAVLSALLRDGLTRQSQPGRLVTDDADGRPVIWFGRPISAEQADEWLDDDE